MISSPTSLMLLFFTFSLFNHLPCAIGWCDSLFQCGNITAGYPFRGGNRGESCGHPLLELHCNKNITSLIISNQEFHVLHINQTSNTLRLARPDLLGPFCSTKFISTPFLPEIFELTETSKSFTVYYFCDPRLHYLSSYTCPQKGLVSISQNPDYQYSCQNSFTFQVPETFDPKENLTRLETVLREGFEILLLIDKLPCQSCLSSQGICGFTGNKQVCCNVTLASQVKCSPLYTSGLDDEVYRRCSAPFSCSHRINLWYPYWIPGREECGHPDFKVNCSRGFPEVTIHSIKFRVLVPSKWPRIRLARSDYISNLCTLDPLIMPFNGMPLPYAPDTELLTLYYDCTPSSLVSLSFQYIGDLGCVNHENSYYVTKNISSPLLNGERLDNLKRFCRRNVSIPASGPALVTLQRSPTLDNLRAALEQGFELGRDQDCSRCEASLGVCGYSQISSGFICHCFNGSQGFTCTDYSPNIRHGFFDGPEIGSLAGVILFAFLVLFTPFVQRLIKARASENLRQKKLMANISLKQYSYTQAKRITNSFAEVIGRGGFGIVYQGTLSDGRKVAVKVLKEANGDGEDFINEVASMSKTSHVNIVSLLGFCLEGSKRAVIYEFVGNGSLDKFISGETTIDKDWKTLYGIALGVARGLEYLHHGCKMRIVHFDIKPHNVLLDDNLCPKISDFGLARLCEKKESILSFCTRGTVGYIAPEMISRVYGSVSHKSDVYSYGMLVLEMIGARNKGSADQNSDSNANSMYFPDWVYADLEKEKYRKLSDNGVTSEEEEIAKKMTLVGLWCIQSSPSDRPPMNRVVEMMEGNIDALEVPPKPVLHQIPAVPLMESSVEYSSTSEALTCSTSTN